MGEGLTMTRRGARVIVPHDWSVEQAFSPAPVERHRLPARRHRLVPRARLAARRSATLAGKHVRLVFHGVYKNADVWVNGYHLGGRPSGYAEFSFDLTEILSYANDDDLVVSVRVEHTDISDSRWYNGSGITRRVELEVHEPVRVAEHGTHLRDAGGRRRSGDHPDRAGARSTTPPRRLTVHVAPRAALADVGACPPVRSTSSRCRPGRSADAV